MDMKKHREERLHAQKQYMTDTELALQIIEEVQSSIDDIKKQILLLKMKGEKQKTMEKELKEEIVKKQEELDHSNQVLQKLKAEYDAFLSQMDAIKMIFDFKLLQEQQCSEKIEEELKVCHFPSMYMYTHALHHAHQIGKKGLACLQLLGGKLPVLIM